ncbi:Hypothetical protein A7982_03158 [Minicystis rosea]|nr:Hypothetical protein A7982_03158 [Minicystis rosea]
MKNVRPTDGTGPHRRHSRYHIGALASGGAPIHAQLAAEMKARYADLKATARATEDAEDDWLGASATSDASEIVLENAVRRLDLEARRADQSDASRNAQKTIFPDGFGPVIAPEGEVQRTTLPALYVRASAFLGIADVASAVDAVKKADSAFADDLQKEQAALAAWDMRFAEEREARRQVREQLESAHARLRDFYKGRAGLAEDFFYREKRRRAVKKTDGEAPPQGPTG